MTYGDCLTRVRRFLRDPDGEIWSDSLLLALWNQAQIEISTKTALLQRADVYPYPSRFTWSHLFDWEYGFVEGDRYQALAIWQVQDWVISYTWESAYWMDDGTPADEGYRWTQCWETGMYAPADVVPVQLNRNLWGTIYVAWDRKPLKVISQRDLALKDRYYKTRMGVPTHIYPIDDNSNLAVLYPRPGTYLWPAYSTTTPTGDVVMIGGVEVTMDGEVVVFGGEGGGGTSAPAGGAGTFDDAGGIVGWTEDATETGDYGIITEDNTGQLGLTFLYEVLPRMVEAEDDTMDWPDFLLHYVEAATLERAFGADTDGYIPSLRDYWRARKEMGIKAMNLLKGNRTNDRSFRMGTARRPARSIGPRLPDHYPAV